MPNCQFCNDEGFKVPAAGHAIGLPACDDCRREYAGIYENVTFHDFQAPGRVEMREAA